MQLISSSSSSSFLVQNQPSKVQKLRMPKAEKNPLQEKSQPPSASPGDLKSSKQFTAGDFEVSDWVLKKGTTVQKGGGPNQDLAPPKKDNIKVSFQFDSTSITKYDIFKVFKEFGPIIRCFVKNKESKKSYKKGFVKFRKAEIALKVLQFKTLDVGGFQVFIFPHAKGAQGKGTAVFPFPETKTLNPHPLGSLDRGGALAPSPPVFHHDVPQNSSLPNVRASPLNVMTVPSYLLEWKIEEERDDNTARRKERLLKVVDIRHRNNDNLRLNQRRTRKRNFMATKSIGGSIVGLNILPQF